MKDIRMTKLSELIRDHSLELKEGQTVQVTALGFECKPLVLEVVKTFNERGVNVFVDYKDPQTNALISEKAPDKRAEIMKSWVENEIKDVDAFLYINAKENDYEASKVPASYYQVVGNALKDYSKTRTNERKWVILNYPTPFFAHKAKMTTSDFEDFSFDVMNVDYKKMKAAFEPLRKLMLKTDKIKIKSPGTDLTFSIKDINAVPCAGECNIPDGEIFTAPVKDSVNGEITYNIPSPYRSKMFENVHLKFKDGKIIDCNCSNYPKEELEEIFNADEGARYVGEFAIGVNPLITKPMGDILYDEKIAGSFHFTPGAAYDEAPNGNDSSVHWDLVQIQTKEYGGGEIYFDDVLIRKDGIFVLDELKGLNPENLA